MYLLVFKINGKSILQTDEDGKIIHYEDKEDLLNSFKDYIRFFIGDYTQSMSATIGMIQINPIGVEFDEPAINLKPFILKENLQSFSSMAVNKCYGAEISDQFIKGRKTIDVFHELLVKAGLVPIPDPTSL